MNNIINNIKEKFIKASNSFPIEGKIISVVCTTKYNYSGIGENNKHYFLCEIIDSDKKIHNNNISPILFSVSINKNDDNKKVRKDLIEKISKKAETLFSIALNI